LVVGYLIFAVVMVLVSSLVGKWDLHIIFYFFDFQILK
jgi:hypothetical protein